MRGNKEMNGSLGFVLNDDDYEGDARDSVEPSDPLFRKIKKNHTAFLIWRVLKEDTVAIPKDQYSTFYDTECYIVYAASQYGKPSGPTTISREVKTGLEQHVHFWLGRAAPAEITYAAAHKCVELDRLIGGRATQHRELQGGESGRFKSYFDKTGIRILHGRDQPMYKKTDVSNPRLFRVTGKRSPFILQMPTLAWSYFTSAYVMILQTPNAIFVWSGRVASYYEKINGTKAAEQLKEEFKTLSVIFVDDGYEKTLPDEDQKELDIYLPLQKRIVRHVAEEELNEFQEETVPKQLSKIVKLYHCSEATGKYRVTEVKQGSMVQSDLCSEDVFIVDHGLLGIWVWVGRDASDKERTEALRNARGFVKKKKYPASVPVTRVCECYEPQEFKNLFSLWKDKEEAVAIVKGMLKPMPTVKVTRYDSETLHDRPALAARSQLLDDGSGTIQKFMIRQNSLQEIPKERNSVFFSAECYIVKYLYKTPAGEKIVLYYWLGLLSCEDYQTNALLHVSQMDFEEKKSGHIIRIIQGRECPHFLQIFKGKMRIFIGKSSDYDPSGRNMKTPSHYLLQVEGSATYNAKAYQINLKASNLNTNYCFVLRKSSHYYVWCGNNSTGDNREMAKAFAGSDFALILEGKEGPEFWHIINGKLEYNTKKVLKEESSPKPARLFEVFCNLNAYKFEEICNYNQEDLKPGNYHLIDAHSTVIIWQGAFCEEDPQHIIIDCVATYLQSDPVDRDPLMCIQLVKQDFEPPTFTGFFENWVKNLWKDYKTYEMLREEIESSCERIGSKNRSYPVLKMSEEFDQYPKYPINILTGPSEKLPSSVDPLKRELHLTFDDFISLTKMPYNEFKILPYWKQQEIKKKVGLF